jgi:hypothetical protein
MYDMNLKPQIFTDITIPAEQPYGPNIEKICALQNQILLNPINTIVLMA